jgi:hypothetical protein
MSKWLSTIVVLTAALAAGLVQTNIAPAQAPQAAAPAPQPTPFNPGVGDLMNMIVQPHHIKLWLAGKEANWPLAEYEAKEVRSALANVAKARPNFRNQPVAQLVEHFTGAPFQALDAAIKDHDAAKFADAYAGLNSGCNGCHTTLNQPQVVIRVPELPFYPDQDFRPKN